MKNVAWTAVDVLLMNENQYNASIAVHATFLDYLIFLFSLYIYIYIYIYISGICIWMAIDVENEHTVQSSNPGWDFIFLKVWVQLISLQLWLNSKADWAL